LAVAGDLNLDITSAGQRVVTVAPGAAVPWQVRGELSTSSTQGLAMVSFDMHFTGGALTAATNPVSMPMQNFAMPLGFTNPAGFGGTVVGNDLVQVGGAQNTILNVFAPYPTGSVITGVAQLGAPQVLATGTLTAPAVVGTYTLSLDNFMANAIQGSATGSPNWAVEPVGVGSVSSMTVVVSALKVNNNTISVATLGSRIYTLEAGAANAGRLYFMLGTFTGTSPGLNFANGLHLPLNPSFYLNWTASNPNTAPLSNSLGFLNGSGMATTTFTLPHVPASAAGLVLHHAYVLLSPLDFASNPVAITLVP
jgi:hypothetical protein